MRKHGRLAWRRMLFGLRLECPPLLPVRVRLVDEPQELFGISKLSRDGTGFNINVSRRVLDPDLGPRNCTGQEMLDSLVHEWAHVLAWTQSHSTLEDHDPLWGVAYALCYQAVIED